MNVQQQRKISVNSKSWNILWNISYLLQIKWFRPLQNNFIINILDYRTCSRTRLVLCVVAWNVQSTESTINSTWRNSGHTRVLAQRHTKSERWIKHRYIRKIDRDSISAINSKFLIGTNAPQSVHRNDLFVHVVAHLLHRWRSSQINDIVNNCRFNIGIVIWIGLSDSIGQHLIV